MSTAQSQQSTVATPTRNRSMDQQYPRPFFGHLMSIENLRPLTRRCDSSSLSHHATLKNSNPNPNISKPMYIPHCPHCAQRPVICNYCQVPVNKKMHNNNNNNNNTNCPNQATTGISRTNVFNNVGNNCQSQTTTMRNNFDNDNSNINNNSNNIIRSATHSSSSQSIRKQPSDHNYNQNQVVQNSQINQVQNQNCSDNSQLTNNLKNLTNYNNSNSNGECSCQPPLIFPSFRPIISNAPRCGWPMKPYNLGAYPRLPGQSPQDPPCFSQTIAHRPSQIVVPELYTSTSASAARPLPPNFIASVQSPSSFGALGDCCTTTRRSSNTQFTPFKSQNINSTGPTGSNPSCCGDEENYRSSYNN